jgi:hypothetical protein
MTDIARRRVSRADWVYQEPVTRSEGGQPIGNGRMATLLWTSPSAIHLQINRSDVFAVNKSHRGEQYGPADYCSACAQVVIDLGGNVFAGPDFRQHLALYQAECTVQGTGVGVRSFVSAQRDILALEIEDRRAVPQPIHLRLQMWRPPVVVHGEHTARYGFRSAGTHLLVEQHFDEGAYHCASAVLLAAPGREADLLAPDEQQRTLVLPARAGKTLVLIASAASWDRDQDIAQVALDTLQAAPGSYAELIAEHTPWWEEFWSRTYVQLASADGQAEVMERLRTRHLYMMATTSRGALPPKFNGMLYSTGGDTRAWGAEFWLWNMELLYYPLFAADAPDLCAPYFEMYRRQLPDAERAAQQRWGVPGAFYPETAPFDGPVILPEDIAREFQGIYWGRNSCDQLSEEAKALGKYDSSLRVFVVGATERPLAKGRYTWISHIVSSGCELAVQAWWRYRYWGDRQWLASHAYPLLRATVEFYRHFAQLGDDGKYHTYPTNVHENFWGVRDGIMDLAAIRGTVPLAIAAAETLGVDQDLCQEWRAFLDRLTPYPMGNEPEAQALTDGALAEDAWAAGRLGDVPGQHNGEQVWLMPVFPFEDYTLETNDNAMAGIAQRTFDVLPHRQSLRNGRSIPIWSRFPILAARVGRGEELPALLRQHYLRQGPLENDLSLTEGEQAHSAEHLAGIATALQEGLLQSLSPRPGQPEILHLFPAWPRAWDAEFRLLARGGFLVTSAIKEGQVPFVEIESRLGESCQLRNPWGGPCVLRQPDGSERVIRGEILCFETVPGGRYSLTAAEG